jgi:putative ABC transport system ATP-binding protein
MLEVSDLAKEYPTPRGPLTVLSGVGFTLGPGDGVAVTGPSGSGKLDKRNILVGLAFKIYL